ncbi:MAG: hypothetical protein K0S98_3087, partial [Propionibacteriaceae bacterium]|nr:hypothetical protein [Propionibacteriaceae bacterium]
QREMANRQRDQSHGGSSEHRAHGCPTVQLAALYASITDFEMRPRSLTS